MGRMNTFPRKTDQYELLEMEGCLMLIFSDPKRTKLRVMRYGREELSPRAGHLTCCDELISNSQCCFPAVETHIDVPRGPAPVGYAVRMIQGTGDRVMKEEMLLDSGSH